jgi:hypothetical protein
LVDLVEEIPVEGCGEGLVEGFVLGVVWFEAGFVDL